MRAFLCIAMLSLCQVSCGPAAPSSLQSTPSGTNSVTRIVVTGLPREAKGEVLWALSEPAGSSLSSAQIAPKNFFRNYAYGETFMNQVVVACSLTTPQAAVLSDGTLTIEAPIEREPGVQYVLYYDLNLNQTGIPEEVSADPNASGGEPLTYQGRIKWTANNANAARIDLQAQPEVITAVLSAALGIEERTAINLYGTGFSAAAGESLLLAIWNSETGNYVASSDVFPATVQSDGSWSIAIEGLRSDISYTVGCASDASGNGKADANEAGGSALIKVGATRVTIDALSPDVDAKVNAALNTSS